MNSADFHIHSTFSDGTETIQKIVKKAIEKNIKNIAITDHDTFEHVDYIKNNTFDGINVYAGIEVSCFDYDVNKKIHIILYNVRKEMELVNVFNQINESRKNINNKVLKLLKTDYNVNLDYLKNRKPLFKQHIIDELIKLGYTDSIYGKLYKKLYYDSKVGSVSYASVYDLLNISKKYGFIAIIAHPELYDNLPEIERYIKCGLNGIEIICSSCSDKSEFIANKYNLIKFGGSDFHGTYGNVDIGDFMFDYDEDILYKGEI